MSETVYIDWTFEIRASNVIHRYKLEKNTEDTLDIVQCLPLLDIVTNQRTRQVRGYNESAPEHLRFLNLSQSKLIKTTAHNAI